MADISSINLNGNSYNIKDNNAVSKNGDIISGTVTFFQPGNSYTDSILCVGRISKTYIGNLNNSNGYTRTGITQENDNGNKEYFRLPISYSTENNNTYDILTSKNTVTVAQGGTGKTTHTANAVLTGNGTSAVNNVATASGAFYATKANGAPSFGTLPVAQGGTGATTASGALTNLGAIAKTGDTMTGILTNTSYIQLKDTGATIGTAPSSDIWGRPYNIVDKNESITGQLRVIYRTSGENQTQLNSINKKGSTTVENALRLTTKNDGTSSVWVSDKLIWRNALGASNGIWPTSVGGTGGTDSGWVNISSSLNTSSVTLASGGYFMYRKIGRFILLWGEKLNPATTNSTQLIKLATLSSALIPDHKVNSTIEFSKGYVSFLMIGADGDIEFYKPHELSTLTVNSTYMYFSVMYMLP